MSRRIYSDTSALGGCFDPAYEYASRRLIDAFIAGQSRLVLSDLTLLELSNAPQRVQALLDEIPQTNIEYVEIIQSALDLADMYIQQGAIGAANLADAQHIAIATVNQVDALVSWNFKHVVRLWRIQEYNAVNQRQGYPALEIHSPLAVIEHD